MTTTGETLAALIESHGIDTIFGIPGVHTVELYRALAASGLRHVTPRHEQGAGLMAYGYWLASGRPAACALITGPGLTNAATAIAQAYSDSVAMLVVAGSNKTAELGLGGGRLHELPNQIALEREIAGEAHLLLDPNNLPEIMARAFAMFQAARPRPAVIEIPRDIFAQECTVSPQPWSTPVPPSPDPTAIARATEMLTQAERPVLLFGGGARFVADGSPTRLAERLDAPVIMSIAGKGLVPSSHPLSLGAPLTQAPARAFLAEADLVVAIGSELSETDFWPSKDEVIRLGDRLIRIDIEAAQLARSRRPDLAIVADAGAAIAALLNAVPQASRKGAERADAARRAINAGLDPQEAPRREALAAIRRAAPVDCFVSVDSTQIAYTGDYAFPCELPGCWHFPSGYGTLGTGLPTAIGAKLARPERPVMAIAGDGGLLFTLEELIVAVEHRLSIPIVLWNNRGYREIAEAMDGAGVQRVGVDFMIPDFQKLAEGYGATATVAPDLAGLETEIVEAFERPGPTLIEVSV
ncbi:MAG: 5-guanidino-2-oxopentanoate decarboxylase [Rhodospirillaceae bacterium]|nr:5-guanidino-2-oxopentanoate decarboxylase [Rhodospirillaceae bacterium]